jgi:hypothetical protein
VAETRRLEALGIVLGMLRLDEPKRGRRRMYDTEADRQKTYLKLTVGCLRSSPPTNRATMSHSIRCAR